MPETLLAQGNIRKMQTQLGSQVQYQLPIGDSLLSINPLIGQQLKIQFNGQIHCVHCGRLTKKSFNQGYCYPCFISLAECDSCIVSPEKCHYEAGTCRDNEWADNHCQVDHIVYLANSSGLKVGITRETQVPTRWMDQGAIQAIPMYRTQTRYLSGLVEVAFKAFVADKTNWRAMLKNEVDVLDMQAEREALQDKAKAAIAGLQKQYGIQAIQPLIDSQMVLIDYPVLQYPSKVSSFNLDKVPELSGKLMGVKGQYLIFDTGVINLRKYTAYHLTFSTLV